MDNTRKKRRGFYLGLIIPAIINIILACIPGWIWVVFLLQWLYMIPVVAFFFFARKGYIAGAILIVGGATVILDIAYCGYAASHGGF